LTNFFIAGLKQPVSEARMDSLMTHFWPGLSELSLIATRYVRRAEIRIHRGDVDEAAFACLQVRTEHDREAQIADQMNIQWEDEGSAVDL
jgi:hypothetical protein